MIEKNRIAEIVKRQEALAAARGTWEAHWQEIADLMAPMRNDIVAKRSAGEKRQQKIFDGTALLAADNLAAGLWGMVTNSANDWFALRAGDEAANEDYEVKAWLAFATQRMRDVFAMNGQRFYSRVLDLYADLVVFGTGIFYVEERVGRGILFQTRPLSECYIAESEAGEIDTIIRKFSLTARQAFQRWGEKAGKKIAECAEKRPDETHAFLHAVMPRAEARWGRLDAENMPFASLYIEPGEMLLLDEGGYREFPYMVPRWSTKSRGLYGDSPAMLALADTKMLNVMEKTNLIGAQKRVDPPILAPDEKTARGVRTHPGAIIYGGMNAQGQQMYAPLHAQADVALGAELAEQRRNAIREAFYHSLMMMVQQPGQTATEILARQEEKLRLMGPHLGRLQSEFLDPLIDRVFAIMLRANQFGPAETIPEALAQSDLKVEYVSPLAKAQKASEGGAIIRALDAMAPLGQMRPEIWDNLAADKTARKIAESFGVPADLMADPEAVQEAREARAQQQNAMAAAQAAKPVAGAMKDMAAAQHIVEQGGGA